MKEKFKLTALERNWILYDIGNSAFTLLVSTLIPIYFNSLAGSAGVDENMYLSYWGYAGSISTILVAIIAPICGTLSDRKFKKPIFLLTVLLGCIACGCLGVTTHWLWFLGIFIFAKVGFHSSLVFYDSMLPEITTGKRMDNVSSMGYAYGYIGSVIPFVLCLVLVLFSDSFGLTMGGAMVWAFLITAAWWMLFTLPLLRSYKQTAFVDGKGAPLSDSFKQLARTFREAKKEKHVFVYLISFFFFINGVYTIIDMATAYGSALGLDSTGLLLALPLLAVLSVLLPDLLGYCFLHRWDYNALLNGEETAVSLGIHVQRLTLTNMVLCCLTCSIIVSNVGLINFIGLVAPHIVRMVVGNNHVYLIPGSVLAGAALLLLGDLIARVAIMPIILPIGAITSFLGGPLFLYLLFKGGRKHD